MDMTGAHNQDFRNIPALWPEIQGKRVLDLGCGEGLYTRELERRGACPVGLDIEIDSLQGARRQAGDRKILWVCGDASRLPFRAEIFELVVSVEVLTHLPPEVREAVLREVHRAAATRASLFITLHNRARLTLSQWLRRRRARKVYDTPNLKVWPTVSEEAEQMAGRCGLEAHPGVKYLNYHSRFTYRFYRAHPHLSRLIIFTEGLLSRLPFLRRLAITFLLRLENGPGHEAGSGREG